MQRTRALEVLDGLMMSDGGLKRYEGGAYYEMVQSKSLAPRANNPLEQELLRQKSLQDHLKWEKWIADNVFTALEIPVSEGNPKIIPGYSKDDSCHWKGEPHNKVLLRTRLSPVLTRLHDEWYTGGKWVKRGSNWYLLGAVKRLPERLIRAIRIPILSLVHEFLGDGGSSWGRRPGYTYVLVSFSTACFTREEVSHLTLMLNNMGVATVKPHEEKVGKGSGLMIRLSAASNNTNHFMGLVEPHILEMFSDSESPSYKDMIKWRPE